MDPWRHMSSGTGSTQQWTRFEILRQGFKGRALTGPESYEQIPALAERGRARVQHFFGWINTRLVDNEYICGPDFTIADISGMVAIDFCGWAKLKPPGTGAFAPLACIGFRAPQR